MWAGSKHGLLEHCIPDHLSREARIKCGKSTRKHTPPTFTFLIFSSTNAYGKLMRKYNHLDFFLLIYFWTQVLSKTFGKVLGATVSIKVTEARNTGRLTWCTGRDSDRDRVRQGR